MNDNDLMVPLKNRLKIERERSDNTGVYGMTQRSFAYHSSALGGNQLTEKQIIYMFETGAFYADERPVPVKDIEDATGHFVLFNCMLDTYEKPLSEALVKAYHICLKAGVYDDNINGNPVGKYKARRTYMPNLATVLPEDVPDALKRIFIVYEHSDKTMLDILKLHERFETVHPFQMGNGRIGRMLMFKECLRNNLVPFIISNSNKALYFRALNIAQHEEDYSLLVKLAKEEQDNYRRMAESFLCEI